MHVVQFRRSRVLKFSLLGLVCLVGVVLTVKQYKGDSWLGSALSEIDDPVQAAVRQAHVSHVGVKPRFLGKGVKGNFEPDSYSGESGPGENGQAHQLRVEQKREKDKLKGVYGFNQIVSDEISLNRTVPDTREEECRYWDYPTDLPTASVILVFHNKGW